MKKKIFLAIVFLLSIVGNISGQEDERFKLALHAGYFTDVFFGAEPVGFGLKGTFGYRFKSGFWLNGEIMEANVTTGGYRDSEAFDVEGGEENQVYRTFSFSTSRDFNLSKKHLIYPSLGLIYQQWISVRPQYSVDSYSKPKSERKYSDFYMYKDIWHDLGFVVGLNYRFKIKEKMLLGLNTDISYYLGLGFVGLSIMPSIEFRL